MKWMAFAVVAMSVVSGCVTGARAPATDSVAGAAAQTPTATDSGARPRAAAGSTTARAAGVAATANGAAAAGTTAPDAGGATPATAVGTTPAVAAGDTPAVATSATPATAAGTTPAAPVGTTPAPAAGTTPAVAASVATPAHAAGATTAAPTTGSTPSVAAPGTTKPVNRALIAQGYQPSIYRGQLYYCRKEKLTGSQFTQRVCLTEQEAALQERIAQDEMNKRNSAGKCLPPLCPNH